jgi:hypothetical protein
MALLADYWQKTVSIDMNLQSTGMNFFKECIKQVLGLESSLDILSATKSLANTGLEAFTSEKCHYTDESCTGKVYTSGNRSNMHLGQIFVLGGYRQDDLYSGKMTNVNGKLELNLTTSNYYHPPYLLGCAFALVFFNDHRPTVRYIEHNSLLTVPW